MRSLIFFSAFLLAQAGCSATEHTDDAEQNPSYYEDKELGGETYAEFDERRDELDGAEGSFGDYGCTQDCSGHEAGYEWAEEKGITDPDDCGGKSWSFEEGCREYASEQSDDEPLEEDY